MTLEKRRMTIQLDIKDIKTDSAVKSFFFSNFEYMDSMNEILN